MAQAMNLFAGVLDKAGPEVAAYFCASATVEDDAFALCVGPNAVNLGNDLYARVPTRLIAPAIGFVRHDFQQKKPGIYVIRNGHTMGPFDVSGAAKVLPPVLDVGLEKIQTSLPPDTP